MVWPDFDIEKQGNSGRKFINCYRDAVLRVGSEGGDEVAAPAGGLAGYPGSLKRANLE